MIWLARLWRCRETACPVGVFTERHDVVPPRGKLITRVAARAADAVSLDDTTVSALARHLGVDGHTFWDAVELEAPAASRTRGACRAWRSSPWTNTSRSQRGSVTRTGP